jgi:hypothetical protein
VANSINTSPEAVDGAHRAPSALVWPESYMVVSETLRTSGPRAETEEVTDGHGRQARRDRFHDLAATVVDDAVDNHGRERAHERLVLADAAPREAPVHEHPVTEVTRVVHVDHRCAQTGRCDRLDGAGHWGQVRSSRLPARPRHGRVAQPRRRGRRYRDQFIHPAGSAPARTIDVDAVLASSTVQPAADATSCAIPTSIAAIDEALAALREWRSAIHVASL